MTADGTEPVGALVVVIAAQERVDPLRGVLHVRVGVARVVVPLIVLAWSRQPGHLLIDARPGVRPGGRERERRRPAERRAHQHHGAEHIRPRHGAPRRDGRPEIMPNDGGHPAIAERRHEAQRVPHHVEAPERVEIGVVAGVPARRPPIAALVRRHDVIPRRGERDHHMAPAVGELGKAMQEQHQRPSAPRVARFQQMHPQAVDVRHEARSNPCRQDALVVRSDGRHRRLRGCGPHGRTAGDRQRGGWHQGRQAHELATGDRGVVIRGRVRGLSHGSPLQV